MLFQPPTPPPNPHAPFIYLNGEIRMTGDLGDRYEADVWLTRERGWSWSAKWTPPDAMDNHAGDSDGDGEIATESEAVTAAVAWLRARCVAVHGRCG